MVSDTLFNFSTVSFSLVNPLSLDIGKSFEPLTNSSISILIFFGIANKIIDANKISLK